MPVLVIIIMEHSIIYLLFSTHGLVLTQIRIKDRLKLNKPDILHLLILLFFKVKFLKIPEKIWEKKFEMIFFNISET